ncbi:hypothetical protein CRYUN_Cryun31cG0067000 [Craigia yunnanensis]
MKCVSGAFPQLHVLKLWQLDNFSKWVVNEGALTSLRELEIRDCRNLKRLDAFYQLTNLRELTLTNMPPDVADYVKGINNTGRDVIIKEYHWQPSPPMVNLPCLCSSFTSNWDRFILDKGVCKQGTHKHLDFAPSLHILARLIFVILLSCRKELLEARVGTEYMLFRAKDHHSMLIFRNHILHLFHISEMLLYISCVVNLRALFH